RELQGIGPTYSCLRQERIISAFMADCGLLTVTRNHERIVVECQESGLNRADDFGIRAAPQICAADTLSKKGVTREQDSAVGRQLEARAAGRVTRCMNGANFDSLAGNCVPVLKEVIDAAALRHRHSDPLRLHVQFLK